MTGPPEFPARNPNKPVPSARTVCPRCGCTVADADVHQQWHNAIEGRVEQVRDLPPRVAHLEERLEDGMP